MDQQEIDVRKLEVGETLLKHLCKCIGHQIALPDLGADEDVLTLCPRLAQALAVFHFVAVERRGVEMAIAGLQGRFDRLDTDVFFQGHSAKSNGRNAGAMSFNHLHHNLLATTLGKRSAEGRAECLAVIVVPTGVPMRRQTAASKDHAKFQTLSITCWRKLFATVLTLE